MFTVLIIGCLIFLSHKFKASKALALGLQEAGFRCERKRLCVKQVGGQEGLLENPYLQMAVEVPTRMSWTVGRRRE